MIVPKNFIPFRLEVLTPVHIGSGEDFSPLAYVIRQPGAASYEIWLIDTNSWLAASQNNPELVRALDCGDMLALRRLLNAANPEAFVLSRIPVASSALGKELMLKRNSIDNRAEIMAFMRNPYSHLPFVPASSIKGAIRTALADFLNEKRKGRSLSLCEATSKEYSHIMQEMFGAIQKDALRWLGLADIGLPPDSTSIRSAIGVSLKPGKTLPKTPCETLNPSEPERAAAWGNMRFGKADGKLSFPDGSLISAASLGKICTEFYRSRFMAEFEKFYARPHLRETGNLLENAYARICKCDGEQQMLLRVGRYSHIESVTVSGRPKAAKLSGTSRTLADQRLPFGWIILSRCSMEEYRAGLSELDRIIRQQQNEQSARKESFSKRRLEEELREKREQEEARKLEIELAALSPQERAIWELGQPGVSENQASAVFASLSSFGDMRIKAAEALRAYWQRIGKWEGKQLSRKQKEKVETVKSILRI